MRLGIMQPYFLPYIGYWQLLAAVDRYVVYDDVNFIKGGWIYRNRILVQGRAQYMNVRMSGSSSFKKINEVQVNASDIWRTKLLRTVEMAYRKAPFFSEVFPLFERIVRQQEPNLAQYLFGSLQAVATFLHIDTQLLLSSDVPQDRSLHGEARVLSICQSLGAAEYINAIGGQSLYDQEHFAAHGITLHFLQSEASPYQQFGEPFIGNLSLLDVLMFNGKEGTQKMLQEYKFIDNGQMPNGGGVEQVSLGCLTAGWQAFPSDFMESRWVA